MRLFATCKQHLKLPGEFIVVPQTISGPIPGRLLTFENVHVIIYSLQEVPEASTTIFVMHSNDVLVQSIANSDCF